MFTATFSEPTRITTQAQLEALFQTGEIRLDAGSQIVCEGEIAVAPGVNFAGRCHFRGPMRLERGSILTNVSLDRDTVVRPYSILSDLEAGARNLFGPFCFIRDNCRVGNDCILGAHVEATRSTFGSGVKISHRAFVGDASVGERTIIGAGVVFCNFDSGKRQPSQVDSDVIVGSGSMIVPPLTIGEGAVIGAGSVVTKDVAEGARFIQKRYAQS